MRSAMVRLSVIGSGGVVARRQYSALRTGFKIFLNAGSGPSPPSPHTPRKEPPKAGVLGRTGSPTSSRRHQLVLHEPRQLLLQPHRLLAHPPTPAPELPPVVDRGDPAVGGGILRPVLLVLLTFNLEDQGGPVHEAHQEIGVVPVRNPEEFVRDAELESFVARVGDD